MPCGVSDTACLLPMARASLPWADIGPIIEMHVHIVSDLVTHVFGPVEDGHGHLQRRFVFTVDDKSVFFFLQKTLLILTETSTGTDRVHQTAANTEVRPHMFTDNNACGAPIKPVLVPYY